jgi:hypothetical protein
MDYLIKPVSIYDIREFITKWHYSKSVNGVMTRYCFGLYDKDILIGACIFAPLGMANVWKKYAVNKDDVIELRRLCCIDDTPKNTESYFISKCIKWLKNNTNITTIVSYADNHHNHTGTIYRASNFVFKGTTSPSKVIIYNDRTYHDKCIRTTYKGKLKPFAVKIKQALQDGSACYQHRVGKNIYVYNIKRFNFRKL